jgi:hypothetical protein
MAKKEVTKTKSKSQRMMEQFSAGNPQETLSNAQQQNSNPTDKTQSFSGDCMTNATSRPVERIGCVPSPNHADTSIPRFDRNGSQMRTTTRLGRWKTPTSSNYRSGLPAHQCNNQQAFHLVSLRSFLETLCDAAARNNLAFVVLAYVDQEHLTLMSTFVTDPSRVLRLVHGLADNNNL